MGGPVSQPGKAAPAAKVPAAPATIVGAWRSDEHTAQVSPGTLTLTADGRVTLAPDGFDPLVGTYKVQNQFLDIKTGRGTATLIHTLTQNTLTLEYENGAVQNFKRLQPPGRTVTPTTKKEAKK
jgi:hypothetical protein